MKIKELVQEGLWDYAKGLVKTGSFAGAQAASQQSGFKKDINDFTSIVFKKWNEYTGQTGNTDIVEWANRFFKTNKINYEPQTFSPAGYKEFLTRVVQDYRAGKFAPVTSQAQKATTSAGEVELVSDEPYVTLKFQNQLYSHPGGGSEGWVVTKTGRKVNKFMQAMLNKSHDQLLGQD